MNDSLKYTICVDSLHMLCVGKIELINTDECKKDNNNECYKTNEEIMLQHNHSLRHPGFLHCYNIFFKKKLFGQLFFGNNSKYRYAKKDICQINIENHILYQSNLTPKLNSVLDELGLEFYKYQYMEIAVDGFGIIKRHNKLTYSTNITRKRLVKVFPLLDEKTKENIGYRLGSTKSDKRISIYSKSSEIILSKKEYIHEFWKRNELMNIDCEIDRCELRSNSKALANFSHNFSSLENPNYLASFFKSSVGSSLEFYENKDRTIRNHLINWSEFTEIVISKSTKTPKAYNMDRYKSMLRNLFEEYVLTMDEHYLYTFANIGARYNLLAWIHISVPRWIREFRIIK